MGYIVGLAKNHACWGWRQSFREQAQADYQAQQQKQRLFGEVKYGGRDVGQSAADAGQGRAHGQGRQSAVCGDEPRRRSAKILRRTLLRTGRDGKSDQGTIVGVVCRPDRLPRLVGQSVSVAALQLRVCVVGAFAGAGGWRGGTGAGASGHDSVEAFKDRRGGRAQHEEGATALEQQLSVSGDLRPGRQGAGQRLN